MRAQVFHGPGDLRFEDAPIPEPGPGEVVLRIEAALTCGTDVKTLRRGHPVMIPRVPTIFGHEFAGTVTAVGAGVGGVRPGDRAVAANSAPVRRVPGVPARPGEPLRRPPLRERRVRRVHRAPAAPGGAQPGDGAARTPTRRAPRSPSPWPAASAPSTRRRSGRGTRWPILGHGPLGLLLGLLARAGGARVVLAGKAGPRLDRARGLGFAACVDVARAGDPVAAVRDAAGGDVRCVIEATGRPEAWAQAMAVVGQGRHGRLLRRLRARARACHWTRAACTTRSCGSSECSTTPRA